MKKFTFKTTKATGPYSSFHPDVHEIKLNKKVVGLITYGAPHIIRFMVNKDTLSEDGNPNCPWKWIQMKMRFSSLDEAKKWIRDNNDKIQQTFNLHSV